MSKNGKIAMAVVLGVLCLFAAFCLFNQQYGWVTFSTAGGSDPFGDIGVFSGTALSSYNNWENDFNENGEYSVPVADIKGLDLKWIAGQVNVTAYDGEDVSFNETSSEKIEQDKALRYGVRDGKLYIQYCAAGTTRFIKQKTLELKVPRQLADSMEELSYDGQSASLNAASINAAEVVADTASGDVSISDITASEVDINTASGTVEFDGNYDKLSADTASGSVKIKSLAENAGETKVDTASGDVEFSGTSRQIAVGTTSGSIAIDIAEADSIQADSTSGSINVSGVYKDGSFETSSGSIKLQNKQCPDKLSADSTSGSVEIYLPEDSGFVLSYDSTSGDMDCDFAVQKDGNKYVCGNGKADINVDTTSGSLKVKKN